MILNQNQHQVSVTALNVNRKFLIKFSSPADIPKEKICDESPIDLEIEAKAQWLLGVRSVSHVDVSPPLPCENWLIKDRVIDSNLNMESSQMECMSYDDKDDHWLSQVEIVTHAGPHRRYVEFIYELLNNNKEIRLNETFVCCVSCFPRADCGWVLSSRLKSTTRQAGEYIRDKKTHT